MDNNSCLYTAEEIASRYGQWSRMNPDHPQRPRAWNRYVDARDGLPDGTTEEREAKRSDPTQISLFSRRLA